MLVPLTTNDETGEATRKPKKEWSDEEKKDFDSRVKKDAELKKARAQNGATGRGGM